MALRALIALAIRDDDDIDEGSELPVVQPDYWEESIHMTDDHRAARTMRRASEAVASAFQEARRDA